MWSALEGLRAERATKRDHPGAVLDAGEPFAAGYGLFADGALDEFAVEVARVVIAQNRSFLSLRVCITAGGLGNVGR